MEPATHPYCWGKTLNDSRDKHAHTKGSQQFLCMLSLPPILGRGEAAAQQGTASGSCLGTGQCSQSSGEPSHTAGGTELAQSPAP